MNQLPPDDHVTMTSLINALILLPDEHGAATRRLDLKNQRYTTITLR